MRTSPLVTVLIIISCAQLSYTQTCTIQDNVNYDTTGDSVTLYNVASASACCSACSGFQECRFFSWVKDSTLSTYKQCQIKNGNSKKISGTASSITSGAVTAAPAASGSTCGSVKTGYDYNNGFLTYGPASSLAACCAQCNNYTGCNFYVFTGSQCYLKGSNSSMVANSGTTAGSIVRPRSVPLRTGKKGIAWFNSHSCSDLAKLTDVSWIYNWDFQPDPYLLQCIIDLGIEYVPMQGRLPMALDKIYTGASYILGFNEPNFASQSNLTPAQAASYWPQIQSFAQQNNMQLVSPAAAAGGNPDPISWFDQFFGNCTGCKVDVIATHIYNCNPVSIRDYLKQFKKYNKPIWLTEFSCPSYNAPLPTVFLNQTLAYLEADPQFARYAWFGTRIEPTDTWLGPQVNLFDSSSCALSPVGQVYCPYKSTSTATNAPATVSASVPATAPANAPATNAPATNAPATNSPATNAPPTSAPGRPSGYLGCFVDGATRDVSPAYLSSTAQTIEKCRNYCGCRQYNFSALQYGAECMCGNSYGSQGSAPDTDCNMPCSGNSQQNCGAGYRNSIYSSASVGYIGCYLDNPGGSAVRDLTQKYSGASNTIDSCRQLCSSLSYKYSGLQYGQECWCGNTYGSFGKAAESDCNMACSGDSSETCGAGARNSIYFSQTTVTCAKY